MPSRHRVEFINVGPGADADLDAAWQVLCARAPVPTPFACLQFARAFADAVGLRAVLCAARSPEGELVGGALGYARRLGPYERLVVPPFVQYTPLLLAHEPSEHEVHSGESVLQLMLQAVKERYGSAALHLQPEHQDLRPAVWAGYRVKPFYTYRIPLDGTQSIQSNWSDNAQRLFRRFTADYQISEGLDHVEDVIDLCTASYDRRGRLLPADPKRLARLVHTLHEAGMVRVHALQATATSACEAGVVVLHDDATAHYWIAGSRPGPAMTVLLGHVLERLASDGMKLFDFVGANTPSIAEFKRRFGPQLVSYYRVEQTTAVGLKLLGLARSWRGSFG